MPQTDKTWRYLPIFAVATYGVFLATFSHTAFPQFDEAWHFWPYLSVQPVGEDAFYYLSTAWNLAAGEGLTADGRTPVTGIQPLFPILLAAPAKIIQWLGGDKWHLIRVVILLQTAIHCAFALLVSGLAGRISDEIAAREQLVVFLLAISSFSLFRLFTYGLESGVYLCLITASVWLSYDLVDEKREHPTWSPWLIGVVFGLTGLARIDFGLALGIFFVFGLVAGTLRWKSVLKSGAAATAVVAPWLGYVYHHMGTIVPSSGVTESTFMFVGHLPRRLVSVAQALFEIGMPFWYVRLGRIASDIGGFVAAAGIGWIAWILRDRWRDLLTERARHWLAAFAVFAVVYPLLFRTAWFYHRYFAPLYIFAIPVLAIGVTRTVDWLQLDDQPDHEPDRPRGWIRWFAIFVMAQFFTWTYLAIHHDRTVAAQQLAKFSNHAVGAGLIDDVIPERSTDRSAETSRHTIGSFQSGTLGYFHDDVVNLDGKVNNDVIPYLKDDRLCEYLDRADVDYLFDWRDFIQKYVSQSCLRQHWTPCGPHVPGPFICLKRSSR